MLAVREMARIAKGIAIRNRLVKGADGENGLKHLACCNLSTQFVRSSFDYGLLSTRALFSFNFSKADDSIKKEQFHFGNARLIMACKPFLFIFWCGGYSH